MHQTIRGPGAVVAFITALLMAASVAEPAPASESAEAQEILDGKEPYVDSRRAKVKQVARSTPVGKHPQQLGLAAF